VNYLEEGGFPALLWDTLKDFGYIAYPKYSIREVMTTGQLLRCEVKVKISVCPTNPAWEEWECMAHRRNLSDTVQKAALEALTTFCGKHLLVEIGPEGWTPTQQPLEFFPFLRLLLRGYFYN
jgi:hypothetical protein